MLLLSPIVSPVFVEAVGSSFVLETVMVKLLVTEARETSVAVTFNSKSPTNSFEGVPVNTPVELLREIQLGNADPSAKVALNVRISSISKTPLNWMSASSNAEDISNVNRSSSSVTVSAISVVTTGVSLTFTIVILKLCDAVEFAISVAVTTTW